MFSDNNVDCQMLCRLVRSLYIRYYVHLLDNFIGICVALTGQEDVFKIYFLTNEQVKSRYKDLTRRHVDLTSQHNYQK